MRVTSRHQQTVILLVCLAALGYFGYHAVEGRHGLEARAVLVERVQHLEAERFRLARDETRLRRNIDLLSDDRIDPDMLGEQARRLLVMTHPHDIVLVPDSRSRTTTARTTPQPPARPKRPRETSRVN
ncbi:MAG: septum formation initiator family protein [Pseudomonadota bacterium]